MATKTEGYDTRIESHNPRLRAIHIGVKPQHLVGMPKFWGWAEDSHPHWAGDHASWDDWGSRRENDHAPIHVVILTYHPDEMVDALFGTNIVPLEPNNEGVTLVVSDPHDWSRDQHTYHIDPAFHEG